MDLTVSSTTLLWLFIFLFAVVLLFSQLPTNDFVKWLEKKNYQYEVTFALYMMTPTEKFVFNSILFLTTTLLLIACVLYLPGNIVTLARRTYYYCIGDAELLSSSRQAAETLYGTATRAGDAVIDAATGWAQTAYMAAWNKTATIAGGSAGVAT